MASSEQGENQKLLQQVLSLLVLEAANTQTNYFYFYERT